MTNKISKAIALVMIIIAISFVGYALGHPEISFPWSNSVTFILYGLYLIVMVVFLIAPFESANEVN